MTVHIHRFVTDRGPAFVFEKADTWLTFNAECWKDGVPMLREVKEVDEYHFHSDDSGRGQLVISMTPLKGVRIADFVAAKILRRETFHAEGVQYNWLCVDSLFGETVCTVFGRDLDERVWFCDSLGNRQYFETVSHSPHGWNAMISSGVYTGGEFPWRLDFRTGRLLNSHRRPVNEPEDVLVSND